MARQNNVIATLDILYLIGWRYHESQQAPKSRGSAEFALKDVVQELNENDEVDEDGKPQKVKYGVIDEMELDDDGNKKE